MGRWIIGSSAVSVSIIVLPISKLRALCFGDRLFDVLHHCDAPACSALFFLMLIHSQATEGLRSSDLGVLQ